MFLRYAGHTIRQCACFYYRPLAEEPLENTARPPCTLIKQWSIPPPHNTYFFHTDTVWMPTQPTVLGRRMRHMIQKIPGAAFAGQGQMQFDSLPQIRNPGRCSFGYRVRAPSMAMG